MREGLLRLNTARGRGAARPIASPLVPARTSASTFFRPYIKSYFDGEVGRRPPDIQIHQNPVIADKLDAGEIDVATMEWWDNRPGYVARPWPARELVAIVPPVIPWVALPRLPRACAPGRAAARRRTGVPAPAGFWRDTFSTQSGDMQMACASAQPKAVKQWVKAGLGVVAGARRPRLP